MGEHGFRALVPQRVQSVPCAGHRSLTGKERTDLGGYFPVGEMRGEKTTDDKRGHLCCITAFQDVSWVTGQSGGWGRLPGMMMRIMSMAMMMMVMTTCCWTMSSLLNFSGSPVLHCPMKPLSHLAAWCKDDVIGGKSRTSYIIGGVPCKRNMRAPCSDLMKLSSRCVLLSLGWEERRET